MSGTDQSPKRAQLRLLGGFDLHSAEGGAAIPAGRKVRALLACLALSPGQAWPREKLMALLWSDRGDEQARASLRQALAEMRRVLGEPSPVRAEHDAVSLDPALLAVDALEFERLAKAGKLDEATALYGGPLLDGHGVRDDAFEDWIRVDRTRLHDLAVDVLHRVAASQTGNAAIGTAQRLLQLDPAREATYRLLMRLYADGGQRAQALRQYQLCRDALWRDLQATPDGETERLYHEIQDESPSTQPMERRVVAILAASVVGYARLMAEDEEDKLARLKACRAEIVDPAVRKHKGRVVKLMGDGLLVEFVGAIDAVESAVAIQQGMVERNAKVPDGRMVVFRIGINLGDVIIRGDDIYGDGVDTAARLQELSEPGGVIVSRTIFEQVDERVNQSFADLGNQQLKNINKELRAYSVSFSGASPVLEQRPMLNMVGSKKVPVTGGCLCGEIRYRVTEPALDTNFCHCRMCQKFSGGPFSVGSTYRAGAVQFTKGEPRYYKSSPFAERGFCANCGSSLTFRALVPAVTPAWADWILLFTGSLDNPAPNVPTWHLGVESQMPWVDILQARKRVRCQDSPDLVEAWAAFDLPVP